MAYRGQFSRIHKKSLPSYVYQKTHNDFDGYPTEVNKCPQQQMQGSVFDTRIYISSQRGNNSWKKIFM